MRKWNWILSAQNYLLSIDTSTYSHAVGHSDTHHAYEINVILEYAGLPAPTVSNVMLIFCLGNNNCAHIHVSESMH